MYVYACICQAPVSVHYEREDKDGGVTYHININNDEKHHHDTVTGQPTATGLP